MQVGTEHRIFHASQLAEGLVKELDGPSLRLCGLFLARKKGATLARKKGATATKDGWNVTKYLDGTLGISIPDFDS